MFQATFSVRVSKTAEILGVTPEVVSTVLAEEGLKDDPSSLSVLDASTTTIEDLVSILAKCDGLQARSLKIKAAASFLKGEGFERPKSDPSIPGVVNTPNNFVEAMKVIRPIQQWNDRELLEKYNQDRDVEIERELNSRAKNRHFIVLKIGKVESGKNESDKEGIDIENSLDLLKLARKSVTPSMIPLSDGTVAPVYYITELNMADRLLELCPFCNEPLYKGYCEKCQTNFTGLGIDERSYIRLISSSSNFELRSMSDKKAVLASAWKGIEDLQQTWPSKAKEFEELKLTNSLPKLVIIASRPTTVLQDPFFADGHRSFGNRSF